MNYFCGLVKYKNINLHDNRRLILVSDKDRSSL